MPAEASAPGREPVAFATENNVHLLNFKEEWYCAVVIIDVADIDVAEGSTEVNMMHRPLYEQIVFLDAQAITTVFLLPAGEGTVSVHSNLTAL